MMANATIIPTGWHRHIRQGKGTFFECAFGMRSKAHIKGHPLHPILVSFPISLFAGAFLLDLIAFISFEKSFTQPALYAEVGGLISAVFAAAAGIIDYHYTVPPHSSAKKRATKHAVINSIMLLVFAASFYLRWKTGTPLFYILLMESVGVVLIGIAAWLGGTLIIRNQIGIDHRYADAGKWNEEIYNTKTNFIVLKNPDSLHLNQMRLIKANGQRIVLARTEKGLVAFEDRCPHRGGSLADGVMICGTVQCPWHGSQFDVHDGAVKAGPASSWIKTFKVSFEKGTHQLHF
jgi:uncharacterized membrane protein/nitrite reductase/ring-hydroxylating ferredoxin subunit